MNDIYIYNTTDDDLYFPKRKKRPSADVMRTRTRREKERKTRKEKKKKKKKRKERLTG